MDEAYQQVFFCEDINYANQFIFQQTHNIFYKVLTAQDANTSEKILL